MEKVCLRKSDTNEWPAPRSTGASASSRKEEASESLPVTWSDRFPAPWRNWPWRLPASQPSGRAAVSSSQSPLPTGTRLVPPPWSCLPFLCLPCCRGEMPTQHVGERPVKLGPYQPTCWAWNLHLMSRDHFDDPTCTMDIICVFAVWKLDLTILYYFLLQKYCPFLTK